MLYINSYFEINQALNEKSVFMTKCSGIIKYEKKARKKQEGKKWENITQINI